MEHVFLLMICGGLLTTIAGVVLLIIWHLW